MSVTPYWNPDPCYRWLVVDGHLGPRPGDDPLDGEGQHPPFYVFDADGQEYMTGPIPTRNAAERLMSILHGSRACLGLPYG